MMANRYILILLLSTILQPMMAQGRDVFEQYKKQKQQELADYKTKKQKEFDEYRKQKNKEFAEYMRQTWPSYESNPAKPVPKSPEPPNPVIKDPDTEPSFDPMPYDEVTPLPKPAPAPQPVVPLPEQPEPPRALFSFNFYGQKCDIPIESKHRFTLRGYNENHVADGWNILSKDDYLPIVSKCLEYRNILHLCDWAYVRFVEKMTSSFFASTQENEARLMQMYILTQSGYKVRIARSSDKLFLLLPSPEDIFGLPYITIGGYHYYVATPFVKDGATFYIYDREFPKEQIFSLYMPEQPSLPIHRTDIRHLQSSHDSELSVDVSLNKNLIDFYNDYPRISGYWNIYSKASLSNHAKEQLYPVLRNLISGKDEQTAANILIHFVQTAFEYKVDDEQFGGERSLFADETLFYPYSDCEDRAILYSILVRELLGLDVVLLYYPEHLATAVCFSTNIQGDHLEIGNQHYTVCDPTYINANIGQAMPQYKQVAAKVIKIN